MPRKNPREIKGFPVSRIPKSRATRRVRYLFFRNAAVGNDPRMRNEFKKIVYYFI